MKDFITRHKQSLRIAGAVVFWLLAWQIAATAVNQQLFIASPSFVFKKLFALFGQMEFYSALGTSFIKISLGFLTAVTAGSLLAALSYVSGTARVLLTPLMSAVRAVPVASFIILAIILVGSENLSLLISFLMTVPIIYGSLLSGADSLDPAMFEAADVFNMDGRTRLRYIYIPETAPFFISACSMGLGLAWKAGVAAEVIGIASGTLGLKLYESKLYLDTAELFAYTFVIVAVSIICEKLVTHVLKRTSARL